MVTVVCLAYNQVDFIRNALDGFVNQKTDFRFKVIVHDDASTDGTADIIREYEKKYPDIIKPIYQKQNQYSQGISIKKSFFQRNVEGKYIANCEGDDYWTDNLKLQKQYDFMESHPDCSACFHCAKAILLQDGKTYIYPQIQKIREYSLNEIILGNALFATASMFRRIEVFNNVPACFSAKGFGDYQAQMYSAICGKVYCLPDVMSVYRCGSPGSWNDRVWNNKEKRILHYQEKIRMLKAVDEYYDRRYHRPIVKKITETEYLICRLEGKGVSLLKTRYGSYYINEKYSKLRANCLKIVSPIVKRIRGR